MADQRKINLLNKLIAAFELEFATIPPYLTCLLSIKPGRNGHSARLIREIMIEEMLHMILVGNLINSIGGQVKIPINKLPSFPFKIGFDRKGFQDRQFALDLLPLSKKSIKNFMKLELPDNHPYQKSSLSNSEGIFELHSTTIAQHYRSIIYDFDCIIKESGESYLFTGDKSLQISSDYFWSAAGKIIHVHDRDHAIAALQEIINQGEGSGNALSLKNINLDSSDELPHFYRLNQIFHGRFYKDGDSPSSDPTGDVLDVNFDEVYPSIPNPKHSFYKNDKRLLELNAEFCRQYVLLLEQINLAFNGDPSAFYAATIYGMRKLTELGSEMCSLPISKMDNVNGAPSFEFIE